MMKLKNLLTLLALFHFYNCIAQEVSGRVKNSSSGELISFVNIGVKGKDLGTISELDGSFSLDVSMAADTDTLRFSYIGYQAVNLSVGHIRKNGFPGLILLKEKPFELKEVVVASKRLRAETLGIRKKDCYPLPLYKKATSNIPFPQPSYQHEIGTFFENKKPLFLDSVKINFTDIQMDTIPLRVNVYVSSENGLKNILNKPLYLNLIKPDESLLIDLSDFEIQIENDFLISIENYKRIDNNLLRILANFKSKGKKYPTYYRKNTQSNWVILKSKSQDFGMSIITYVRK